MINPTPPSQSDPFSAYPDAPPETDAEKIARFQRDYHAPDRATVLAQMGASDTGEAGKPAAPAGAPGAGGKDPNAFKDAWFASGGKTTTDLANFVKAHPEFGATIAGSKGSKVTFPGGAAFQAVRSAGINGGVGPAWDDLSSGGGSVGVGDFGSLAQGFNKSFTAPTTDEIRNTPGYQFALTEGVKSLDTAAAARGTVLGGGEKKDILQYATGLADQTAQQKYSNALGEYMNEYQIFRNNGNDIFGRFKDLSAAGTDAAKSATA